ncbi:MAG: hypothetical protein HYX90_07940 [Chloroflexi bacterium]|nr:hypothetical protein [Chloroflexota bacterium]
MVLPANETGAEVDVAFAVALGKALGLTIVFGIEDCTGPLEGVGVDVRVDVAPGLHARTNTRAREREIKTTRKGLFFMTAPPRVPVRLPSR